MPTPWREFLMDGESHNPDFCEAAAALASFKEDTSDTDSALPKPHKGSAAL
jgi:hypothetical protein